MSYKVLESNARAMGYQRRDGVLTAIGGIGDLLGELIGTAATAIAPHFSTVGTTCKPTDSATLSLFKELQRQLNRVAAIKKIQTIGVDGDIGSGTVALMQAVQAAAKADLKAGSLNNTYAAQYLATVQSSTCSGIASGATGTTANVKTYADQLGASSNVASPPPASQPAVYNPINGASVPQGAAASAIDAWKRLSTGTQLATLGILGVTGVVLLKPGKKKRK